MSHQVHALECKYHELYSPIYTKRGGITKGEHEPTDQVSACPSHALCTGTKTLRFSNFVRLRISSSKTLRIDPISIVISDIDPYRIQERHSLKGKLGT